MEEELLGNKYLVTTPIKETRPEKGKIIFLGEWCKLYSKRSEWEKVEYDTIPYHWENRSKLDLDLKYLLKFRSNLLIELTQILNKKHNVNYNSADWDKFIGWWLFFFICLVFDRWESIRLAEKKYSNLNTICIKINQENLIASNSSDFFNKTFTDNWNSKLFNDIINYRGNIRIKFSKSIFKNKHTKGNKNGIKANFFVIYQKIISLFKSKKRPLILNSYVSFWDDFVFILNF